MDRFTYSFVFDLDFRLKDASILIVLILVSTLIETSHAQRVSECVTTMMIMIITLRKHLNEITD